MIRKFFIFLSFLLCSFSAFAATDLGTVPVFTISGTRTSESAVDSSATVFTLTADDIETNHYESLGDALTSIGSVSINSMGSLGALQNADVNGLGSSTRTIVYLNGAQLNTSYDNNFDLNAIPVSAVEKIEVITSGSGKNSSKLAAGGIINITTKKTVSEPSLDISFENGSFLPGAKGIGALIDSQDLHVTYANNINGHNVILSLGGMRAANNYSFKADKYHINRWTQRKNAGTWASDAMVNVNGNISGYEYSSANIIRYQHLGVPGSLEFGLTPKDYQNNLLVNTANRIEKDNVSFSFNYTYNPVLVYYADFTKTKDSHFKHNLSAKVQYEATLNENLRITPYAETGLEIAKSSSLDKTQLRFYPKLGFNSSISFKNLALYPIADIGYTTDMKKWFPNACIGADYTLAKNLNLTGNLSFSHRLPTFSDLYLPFAWGYKGNPSLKPEKSLSADIGLVYDNRKINASFDFFSRWINDLILISADFSTMNNIDDAFFMGFNANTGFKTDSFSVAIGWLFNKSYDLTNGNSMDDEIPVNNVRLHTLTLTAAYDFGKFTLSTDAKYLGKYHKAGKEFDGAFVWNVGFDYHVLENLRMFMKIDNILNTQYQLSDGYPMPGMKVRIGGKISLL